MTTPPTDAELRAALELAAKATPGPWVLRKGVSNGQGELETRIDSDTGVWEKCSYGCFGWEEGSPVHRGEQGQLGHEHKTDPHVISGFGWHGSGDLSIYDDDGAFVIAARLGWPAAAEALLAARAALREVHKRVVSDYYIGIGKDSPRYWSCRLCMRAWKHGDAESHEPTCPLANRTVLGGDA